MNFNQVRLMLFIWTSQQPSAMQQKNADLAVATVSLTMKEGEENAVAIKKGNSDLKEMVDKVIQKLKDDGTYQTYLEKLLS